MFAISCWGIYSFHLLTEDERTLIARRRQMILKSHYPMKDSQDKVALYTDNLLQTLLKTIMETVTRSLSLS